MNLKGNQIKGAVIEIARAFLTNKKALTLKEIDLSKCGLLCDHIKSEFCEMLKSPYTTLRILKLQDNLIRR